MKQARPIITDGHVDVTRPLTPSTLIRGTRLLCQRDRALAANVRRHGPPPLWARRPGFATLVRIVLEQQVSLASARATYARLVAGVGRVTARRISALDPAALQAFGLTRQKAAYTHGIATRVVDGGLDLRALGGAADASVRRALQEMKGIGSWTADIYLLMALRRPDVWPDGDLALASAVKQLRNLRRLPSRERLQRIAAAWAPWRAVAARILWHTYLQEGRARQAT